MQTQVLKIDVSGIPDRWISIEAAACVMVSRSLAWTAGEPFATLRGGRNASGEQSTIRVPPIVAVCGTSAARALMNSAPSLTRHNHKLFQRDRYTCAYCADVLAANKLEREHIVPVSRGGANSWMNVVSACHPCNQRKANRTPEEANMPLLYVPYVPTRWEDLILQARAQHILADQMAFLRARLPAESRLRG
jgi:5-methylcytosine-specific restriction endonuclease McrA